MKKQIENTLETALITLLEQKKDLTMESILKILAGRGLSFLLVALSLPFCQPFQIPGFSTPFGLLLAFIGLRIAIGKNAWLPQFLKEKVISYSTLKKVANLALKIVHKLRFFLTSRLVWLVRTPTLHFLHGLTIFVLGLILALPLPIPLTNVLAALPILFFGLGLLEDDGIMIIIAYILSLVCFAVYLSLIWFGKEGISYIFSMM